VYGIAIKKERVVSSTSPDQPSSCDRLLAGLACFASLTSFVEADDVVDVQDFPALVEHVNREDDPIRVGVIFEGVHCQLLLSRIIGLAIHDDGVLFSKPLLDT